MAGQVARRGLIAELAKEQLDPYFDGRLLGEDVSVLTCPILDP